MAAVARAYATDPGYTHLAVAIARQPSVTEAIATVRQKAPDNVNRSSAL
jgi:hypothetical protein